MIRDTELSADVMCILPILHTALLHTIEEPFSIVFRKGGFEEEDGIPLPDKKSDRETLMWMCNPVASLVKLAISPSKEVRINREGVWYRFVDSDNTDTSRWILL